MATLVFNRRLLALTPMLALGVSACGGDGGGRESEGASATLGTGVPTSTSVSTSGETGDEDSTTQDATQGSATQGSATQGEDSTSGPTKFDLEPIPDAPSGDCSSTGGGDGVQSYIWIANSSENTISKLNTKTIVEEGRYLTRQSAGSPSRTSVNLAGDVAVANRNGGVTKVVAITENCDPMTNGVPGLQTSTGANDILAWGQDDCVVWHTAINYTANRPAAWTFGTINQTTCEVEDAKLWTAASNGASSSPHAMRLNGDTGVIEDDVVANGFSVNGFGPYGGAVDPDENFWMISHSSPANLARIDGDSLAVSTWTIPNFSAYGFTIDEYGRPWVGGLDGQTAVFDPETEQFSMLVGGGLGMGQAANGIMWQATHPSQTGIRGWDIDTLQIVNEITIPGVSSSRGVSVDIDGYVWFVEVGNDAFKIDPATELFENYPNLVGAYTYSDMTGNALSLVAGGIAG